MISIVICSRDKTILHDMSQNVAATIGVPYEIIAIDNSTNKYGICSAYNAGASRSKYDLLCFAHEDIRFETDGWGKVVVKVLEDRTIGVLGIVGGTYQAKAPTGWGANFPNSIYMNILHSTRVKVPRLDYINPTNTALADVAAVDGVWLCARKSVWQESPFDDIAFPNFHFYDIDFCTRIFPKYRICVTFDITLEHFSEGSYNDAWYKSALEYYKRRINYLPFGVADLSDKEKEDIDLKELIYFTCCFIDRKISKSDSLYLVNECMARNSYNRKSWWLIKKIFSKSFLFS